MKLIFIYGPPGVGKLTVAKELAKLTGYKLFHNHLTVNLVNSIFPFGTKEYSELTQKIRLDLLEAAAKSKVKGIIFTFVYGVETLGGKTDNQLVRTIINKLKKHEGKVLFVKLTCDEKELYRRVKEPSRNSFGKLTKANKLKAIKKEYDVDAIIPFGENLIIDNTQLSPKKAATRIRNHYKLGT